MAALTVPVRQRQAAGHPDDEGAAAARHVDPAHADARDRWLKPVPVPVLERRLQVLRVVDVKPHEVDRDAVRLRHAHHQLAALSIGEAGEIVELFFLAVAGVGPQRLLVVELAALGHLVVDRPLQVGFCQIVEGDVPQIRISRRASASRVGASFRSRFTPNQP